MVTVILASGGAGADLQELEEEEDVEDILELEPEDKESEYCSVTGVTVVDRSGWDYGIVALYRWG